MLSVHLENGRIEMRDIPQPERPPGFVLIRLLVAGICNTDLELLRGYYSFRGVPGHEFVGEVVAADRHALVGRRVVGEINLGCGFCDWCARGMGRHCPRRKVLGILDHPGAFQELFTLPEVNLHEVPDDMATDRAVFTEPLAAACEILEQVTIPEGRPVAVIGDGKLGLLIAQTLLAHGHAVEHFGRHADKLAISERAGARVHNAGIDPETRAPGARFDFVVEATGSSGGVEASLAMLRPRGTLILKSTVHDRGSVDWSRVVVNEITLIGSRCGPFPPALRLLEFSAIDTRAMIHARFPLAAAEEAFAAADRKGVLKVLLEG